MLLCEIRASRVALRRFQSPAPEAPEALGGRPEIYTDDFPLHQRRGGKRRDALNGTGFE